MIFHLKIEVPDDAVKGISEELKLEHSLHDLLKDNIEAEIVVQHGEDYPGGVGIPFRLMSIVDEHGSEWW